MNDNVERPAVLNSRITRRNMLKPLLTSPALLISNSSEHVYGSNESTTLCMVILVDKCISCGACVVACTLDNTKYIGKTVSLGSRTNFYFIDVKGKKIPYHKICMHCEELVCTYVCPTGATYKTEEGLVVDYSKCINCRYCIFECPSEPNVRYVNEELGAVDKCTWCYHRIVKGLKPACVEACPTNARMFGDLKDPESTVSRVLRDN